MSPILILGMHRSGTSFLAKSLYEYGLSLPGASQNSSPFNPKGNYEKREIVIFHENILKKNHGSWSSPPTNIEWQVQHTKRAHQFLLELTQQPSGFKDPRTLLHLTQWQTLCTPRYVGIFRHPSAVAHSLNRRDNLTLEDAINLWSHYNTILIELWKKSPFPLINFDAPTMMLQKTIKKAATTLNLPKANENIYTLDPSLKHHHHSAISNKKAQSIYDSLIEASAFDV